MLRTNSEPTFAELLDKHPLTFRIPDEVMQELGQRGELPRWNGAINVATRFRCFSPVIVECLFTLPVLKLSQPTSRCILRDISQSGMSFLSRQQYYPDQILKLTLPVAIAKVRVARCRFIDSDCFEIGVRTLEYSSTET